MGRDAARSPRAFLTHAAIYGFGTLILQAGSIVLLPLYTRHLAPAEFGVLEIISRVGDILNICLMAGGIRMAALTFYNQSKDEIEREKAVTATTITVYLLVILGGAVAVAFPGRIGSAIGVDRPALVAFGILSVLLDALAIVPLALMQARVESLRYVCVSAAIFLVRVTLAVILVAVLHWGIWGIFAASATTSAVFGIALTWRELARGSIRFDWTCLKEVLRFAAPFVPGGLCFFALRNGDRFLLMQYVGAGGLGIYALGYKLAGLVGTFTVGPLYNVWGAKMFDAFELPDAPSLVGRVVTRILAAYVFVAIGVCVLCDEAIAVLASAEYAGATAVVGPIVLAIFFLYAANLMDAAFYVRRRTGLKPWIMAASMVVALGLYAWLIPQFGAMGAAFAALGGFMFHAAATWAVSQRVFHVQYEYGRVGTMLASAIAVVLLAGHLDLGIVNVPAKLGLWAAWPAMLWITGLVSKDEKAMVMAAIDQVGRRAKRLFFASPEAVPPPVADTDEVV